MTPDKDKVEAALAVLHGGRRMPHCDESLPAGIVFVGDDVAAFDRALDTLTAALAERETLQKELAAAERDRDAARAAIELAGMKHARRFP